MRSILTLTLTAFITIVLCSCGKDDGDAVSGVTTDSSIDATLLVPSCFTPYASNPILQSGDQFTGSTWNDPSVLYENGQYIMYASSDVSFDGDIKIYRLVSSDGINFQRSPTTAVLEKGSGSAWDNKSVETPSVVNFNGTYHLFYTGYQTNTPTDFKIGHATSSDGITWTKNTSNPIIASVGGSAVADDFDQFITAEPGASVFNGQIFLYFAAQGYITTSNGQTINDQFLTIGLVTSNDGQTFSTPQRVLDADQDLFPRSSDWKGLSTPAPIVLNGEMHLFVDVLRTVSGSDVQQRLFHARSTDGRTNFINDTASIHTYTDFSWTSSEIRAPWAVTVNQNLRMYYAGNTGLTLAIGFSDCNLAPR